MADKRVRMSDLSENVADKRVTWALGSKRLVIDLTTAEYEQFQEVLKPYVEASRTPPRRKKRASK